MPTFVKVFNEWHEAETYVKVFGQWHEAEVYVKVAGQWRESDVGPPPVTPGFYVLSAISKFIPPSGGPSWALFNTSAFIGGNIIGVDARVSWATFGSITGPINGRPSGTFYRSLVADTDFANRTIDHQIDAGIPQFITGQATGYTIGTTSNGNGVFIRDLRLRIEIGP